MIEYLKVKKKCLEFQNIFIHYYITNFKMYRQPKIIQCKINIRISIGK